MKILTIRQSPEIGRVFQPLRPMSSKERDEEGRQESERWKAEESARLEASWRKAHTSTRSCSDGSQETKKPASLNPSFSNFGQQHAVSKVNRLARAEKVGSQGLGSNLNTKLLVFKSTFQQLCILILALQLQNRALR